MATDGKNCKLSPRQQDVWSFAAEFISSNNEFPQYADIAGEFKISTAAVAHILNALEQKQRLLRKSCFPYPVLLDEMHNIFVPANQSRNSSHEKPDAGFCRYLPEEFKLDSSDNIPLTIVSDRLFQYGIREGDIIEVCKIRRSEIKPGDLLLIISGANLLLRFAAYGKNNSNLSGMCFNIKEQSSNISGKVTRLYRKMF